MVLESHDIVILAVGICSLLAAFLSYLNGRKLDVVHVAMNSRLDALLASSAKVAYAAGHEAAMQSESDKAVKVAKETASERR